MAEWQELAKHLTVSDVISEKAKAALTENLKHLVQALAAELLGESRQDVLSTATHTLKHLPPLLPVDDGKSIAEIGSMALSFQELRRARQSLEDPDQVFEKREQKEMRLRTGQLVQKLKACQALVSQERNAALFCKSLEKIKVDTEKHLQWLKHVFQAKYEAVFKASAETLTPIVAAHAEWKSDLMGNRESVSLKKLLKSAEPALDTSPNNKTVQILHLYTDFTKD